MAINVSCEVSDYETFSLRNTEGNEVIKFLV